MRIILAAGGTAGHINPAMSLGKFVRQRRPESDILFVGSPKGLEAKLVPAEGFALRTLKISGFQRGFSPKDIAHNVKAVKNLLTSLSEADKILREFCPDVVVGTGGYASFPVVYQAARRGIPTAIHESNAIPGMTTKMLAKKTDRVMVSFEETIEYFGDKSKTVLTGNPLREGIVIGRAGDAKKALGLTDKPVVLSFWGSLGAREMNKKIADFMALEYGKGEFYHIHSTGSFGYKWMPGLLKEKGIDTDRYREIDMREYINDMSNVMAASDLVISRAGAMTLSEICALGKPSIIVPSPNVTDNHQEKNARAMEKRGASVVFLEKECTGEVLYNESLAILADEKRRKQMSDAAYEMAVFDATDRIYDTISSLL